MLNKPRTCRGYYICLVTPDKLASRPALVVAAVAAGVFFCPVAAADESLFVLGAVAFVTVFHGVLCLSWPRLSATVVMSCLMPRAFLLTD